MAAEINPSVTAANGSKPRKVKHVNPLVDECGLAGTAGNVATVLEYLALVRPLQGCHAQEKDEDARDMLLATCAAALRAYE